MNQPKISLILFNNPSDIPWGFGDVYNSEYTMESICVAIQDIQKDSDSEYVLFWDATYKIPSDISLLEVLNSKGDLWHVGSKLEFAKNIPLLDCIQPTSMNHLNVSSDKDHTSWKICLKGCLMKRSVFDSILKTNTSSSVELFSLDFGFKAIKSGVITRYSNRLAQNISNSKSKEIALIDEMIFIKNNFDKKAFVWCYLSNIFRINPMLFLRLLKTKINKQSFVYNRKMEMVDLSEVDTSVSIVIATLERYHCLEDELIELRQLNLKPKEIIIVDQTPKKIREKEFLEKFNDLPIVYIETDKIGQCSSRNLGIQRASSKFIWFLDDDMKEIKSDHLKIHLNTIYQFNSDISCGIPDELGTDYIDRSIPKIEISEGMPMGDTLCKRQILIDIGGFDEKMDQKQSEDQEIGLRCLEKGCLNLKNNQLQTIHLRASRGGLRNHNVRKITFSSARKNLLQRRFLHHSEMYLNLKHFGDEKVKKLMFLSYRGTFIIRGNKFRKFLKVIIGMLLLPHTIYMTRKNLVKAKKML